MNQMFRKPDQEPARHDDLLSRGREDWDNRVSQAIAGQTAWKRALYAALGVIAISAYGNVWQAQQSKVQTVHIVHDGIGGVIAVSVSSDAYGEPTQAMLKAALEQWIINVRSVYVDIDAMKKGFWAATYLIDARSQSEALVQKFWADPSPWKRAETGDRIARKRRRGAADRRHHWRRGHANVENHLDRGCHQPRRPERDAAAVGREHHLQAAAAGHAAGRLQEPGWDPHHQP